MVLDLLYSIDGYIVGNFGFQEAATRTMDALVRLHHYVMLFVMFIAGFVAYLFIMCLYYFWYQVVIRQLNITFGQTRAITKDTVIEFIWTVIPSLIIFVIALPSLSLLYAMDEVLDPHLMVKILGHQWYWSYEYSVVSYYSNHMALKFFFNYGYNLPLHYTPFELNNNSFYYPNIILFNKNWVYDSYMVEDVLSASSRNKFRLLEVDKPLYLPIKQRGMLLITSTDVIHSFAVPSLGIKIDACPGRVNQICFYIDKAGVYYGQCSELCGVNHAFMPICILGVHIDVFEEFLKKLIIDLDIVLYLNNNIAVLGGNEMLSSQNEVITFWIHNAGIPVLASLM